MTFTEQKLAQNLGYLILQLWKVGAENEELRKLLPQAQEKEIVNAPR